jgi:hypothetical protein
MTKRELLEKLMGVAMDAQVVVVDATDYEDTEYEISEVVCLPLDKHPADAVNIVINEGVFTK